MRGLSVALRFEEGDEEVDARIGIVAIVGAPLRMRGVEVEAVQNVVRFQYGLGILIQGKITPDCPSPRGRRESGKRTHVRNGFGTHGDGVESEDLENQRRRQKAGIFIGKKVHTANRLDS